MVGMFPFTHGILGSAAYVTGAVAFDGVNDYMQKTSVLSGVSTDTTTLTISGWVNFNSTAGDAVDQYLLYNVTGLMYILKTTTNILRCNAYNSTGGTSTAFNVVSTGTYTSTSGWIHLALSRNSTTLQLWINGANAESSASSVRSTALHSAASTGWTIGAVHPGGTGKTYAHFADWIANFSTGVELSANIIKFRSAAGKPVDMGANGNTPFTAAPHFFFKHTAGSSGSTFAVDRSTNANNFTITGALAESTSSPSD